MDGGRGEKAEASWGSGKLIGEKREGEGGRKREEKKKRGGVRERGLESVRGDPHTVS